MGEIEKRFKESSPSTFLNYASNLPDSCYTSYVCYFKAKAYFLTNQIELATKETLQIIDNSENGHSHYIELWLNDLFYLLMEESRRLKNEVEFNKWKALASVRKDKKCLTGHAMQVSNTYWIMKERFLFQNDKKGIRLYQRKSGSHYRKSHNFFKY